MTNEPGSNTVPLVIGLSDKLQSSAAGRGSAEEQSPEPEEGALHISETARAHHLPAA
jgi:hypothetical protein